MYQLNDVKFIEYFLNLGKIFEVFIILEYSLLSQMIDSKYIQNLFCFEYNFCYKYIYSLPISTAVALKKFFRNKKSNVGTQER
jgi:hypothetical protein